MPRMTDELESVVRETAKTNLTVRACLEEIEALRTELAASKAREDAAFNKGIDTLARKMHVAYWWKEEIRALKQKRKQETPPRSELRQDLQIKMDRIIDESQETPRGI